MNPRAVVQEFLSRQKNHSYFGDCVESKTAKSPMALRSAIVIALENDATIIVPFQHMILSHRSVSSLILTHRVEVRTVDGAIESFKAFAARSIDFELEARERRERAKRNGAKAKRPSSMSRQVSILGAKASSERAKSQRQIVAQHIKRVLVDVSPPSSYQALANIFNDREVPTLRDGGNWHYNSVKRIMEEYFPNWRSR